MKKSVTERARRMRPTAVPEPEAAMTHPEKDPTTVEESQPEASQQADDPDDFLPLTQPSSLVAESEIAQDGREQPGPDVNPSQQLDDPCKG